MQNFKVSKIDLSLLFSLNIFVIIMLVRAVERGVTMEIALLSTSIFVGIIYFLSLLKREIIFNEKTLHVNSGTSKRDIELNSVDFIQTLSAFGRYVVIISDGKSSATFTSLIANFSQLIDKIKIELNPEVAKRLDIISPSEVKRKKVLFTVIMAGLNIVALYAIIMK